MKKLILSIVLTGMAVAAQAGDCSASADKDAPSCCAKAKAATEAKGECPMAKGTCSQGTKSAAKQAPAKQVLLSPKAASLASR